MELYKNMGEEAQLKWVTEFAQYCADRLPVIAEAGVWDGECMKVMEEGLTLISAFDFATRFVEKTRQTGDYECRAPRLCHYVEQIKEEISAATTVVSADGQKYAYIPALQAQKKRGRPSAEQKMAQKDADSVSTKKEQKIAQLMGREIITLQTQREKNNEELAQERLEREQQAAQQQPSLFGELPTDLADLADGEKNQSASADKNPLNPLNPLATEERRHLHELKFLMSADLAREVDEIRVIRGMAASASEHAKALAEQGADASKIAPYAQEAAEQTELYESIYERVDAEMAEVYVRLCEDEKYLAVWEKKADVATLKKWTKPYLAKMAEGFADQVRAKIASEQPEVVAARQKAKEDRQEAAAIRKYMLRTDKPNTAKRIKGMEEKYQRLVELIGEEEAKAYLPVIAKAKEDLKKSIDSKL